MSLYKYELTNNEYNSLYNWIQNKEWHDIKKQLYKIIKNNYNSKYNKSNNANNDIMSIMVKLTHKMNTLEIVNLLKELNKNQIGGVLYSKNEYNNTLHGGINFGKLASMVKSKASLVGKQAKTYAQQQAEIAKDYAKQQAKQVQTQAQDYLKQQASQAQEYLKQQALQVQTQAQQYAQQQAQQIQQQIENKVAQVGQKITNYLPPIQQGYIVAPSVSGYGTAVTPMLTPTVLSDTSLQTTDNLPISTVSTEPTGLVESVFDYMGSFGEKIVGL